MSLFCRHHWETTDQWLDKVYGNMEGHGVPKKIEKYIQQRCTKCGKEIVRKYHA